MKKLISLLILGCFSLYGFSIHPIDPPAKKGEPVKTITQPAPVVTKECSDSRGDMVEVTVYVTFTDCPDYECDYKDCIFYLYIYDAATPIGYTPFDPEQCTYTLEGLRAEEGHYLYSHLVPIGPGPPPYSCEYNDGYDQSSNQVPPGGGNVYINTTLCQ
ncbi:MAG: hypothetical protein ISS17_00015 [Bacteroidales bacterium]|nr:hypothetical protein [Bacteroidales bacterium]